MTTPYDDAPVPPTAADDDDQTDPVTDDDQTEPDADPLSSALGGLVAGQMARIAELQQQLAGLRGRPNLPESPPTSP